MATDDQERDRCCFLKWMNLQEQELSELHQTLTLHCPNNENEDNFSLLAQKCIEHYQDYADKRSQLAHNDVSAFFAPAWCTNWENSLLWLACCRPSQYIRLVYALCGLEIEVHLSEFLQGTSSSSANLGYLSSKQLHPIDMLQGKTLRS
ncbi:protein DELAY OF GERMINATION 1-like [Juglans microcarpa x Juglans regia]|uniref:protein DELAY OF GERMINATION 1-like n=1 Tax=Juglans microcarpa x Juglans regia TaxID=2249226 RepID=UPI001B7E4B2B|nr:protein DELAY OF GERMINATION 1-like [Juglans microcarpa x Juglans regia]